MAFVEKEGHLSWGLLAGVRGSGSNQLPLSEESSGVACYLSNTGLWWARAGRTSGPGLGCLWRAARMPAQSPL